MNGENQTIFSLIATSTNMYLKQQDNTQVIQYSTNGLDWTNIDSINWPIKISTELAILNIILQTNLTLTSNKMYLIIGNNNIKINGNNKKVFVKDVVNYSGFIQNGTGNIENGISNNDAKSNININNIGVISQNSSLDTIGSGWICQRFFGINTTGCTINNSYSVGKISNNCGGLLGPYSYCNVVNSYCVNTN